MDNKHLKERVVPQTMRGESLIGTALKYFGVVNDNKVIFDNNLYNKQAYNSDKTTRNSCFFGELFKGLGSGKVTYKTYLNKLFEDNNTETKYVPSNVNCLIKRTREDSAYGEVVGSRLANLLGVDTVFNVAIEDSVAMEYLDLSYCDAAYEYTLSVDYIPEDYKTEDLQTLEVLFSQDDSFDIWLTRIDEALPRIAKKLHIKLTSENVSKFKEDLCKMYIFRNLLCDDYDMESKNISILYNEKTGDFYLAPNLDMEYLFKGGRSYLYSKDLIENNMRFIRENYPHIIKDMMKRINNNLNNGKLENIMYNTLKFTEDTCAHKYKVLERNAELLDEFYNCDINTLPNNSIIDTDIVNER